MAPFELERRVRDSVVLQAPIPEDVWSVGVSAGGSMLAPWDAGTLETLLGKADQEMYLRRSLRRRGPPEQAAPPPPSDLPGRRRPLAWGSRRRGPRRMPTTRWPRTGRGRRGRPRALVLAGAAAC